MRLAIRICPINSTGKTRESDAITRVFAPGGTPIYGLYGMCRSTGYGFCLSESGAGSTNQHFCLEQGILFAILTLEHSWGDYFAARIAVQMNVVAVPALVPLHVAQNTPFSIRRSTLSHVYQSGTGYLFSRFCLEQGSKIESL